MIVVDVFSGLGGWSRPARERGHDVTTLDLDPRFGADVVADVAGWLPPASARHADLLLASPPCETFSALTLRRNWTPEGEPATAAAAHGLAALEGLIALVDRIEPRFWVMENPRAGMRHQIARRWPALSETRRTITYCAYGEPMQKPTDLWGVFPPSLELSPPCRPGDPCHAPAPRGSEHPKGSQRWNRNRAGNLTMEKRQARALYGTSDMWLLAALRSAIPRALALAVIEAAERDSP